MHVLSLQLLLLWGLLGWKFTLIYLAVGLLAGIVGGAIMDALRAERWLQTHTYTNPIIKWETERWGEIPADFGRK